MSDLRLKRLLIYCLQHRIQTICWYVVLTTLYLTHFRQRKMIKTVIRISMIAEKPSIQVVYEYEIAKVLKNI